MRINVNNNKINVNNAVTCCGTEINAQTRREAQTYQTYTWQQVEKLGLSASLKTQRREG